MGGGHWNGKNFGGMHTSDGKKQNAGPYSNNGFQPDPFTSHRDFVEGDEVIYTGSSSKNKNKRNVPNGAVGTVVEKGYNRLQKSSRSTILVDFGQNGIRYVSKNCLMFPSDAEECMEKRLDAPPVILGVQSHRRKQFVTVEEKLTEEPSVDESTVDESIVDESIVDESTVEESTVEESTVESSSVKKKIPIGEFKQQMREQSRLKRKEYREFRKELLDNQELELNVSISSGMNNPDLVKLRNERNKINESIDEINKNYGLSENLTKLEYMNNHSNGSLTSEQLETMFNSHKEKDMRRVKILKQHLINVSNEIKKKSKDIGTLEDVYNSDRRYFTHMCATPEDYKKMVRTKWDKVQTKWDKYPVNDGKPSREYSLNNNNSENKVCPPPVEDIKMSLLKWGLCKRDVGL
jgi:hypothetical protein